MSAVEATQYTARKTTAPAAGTFIDAGKELGVVRVVPFDYTAASLASGSTIALVDVSIGDTVFGVVLNAAALGSPVTLAVGDSVSSTHFLAATAATSAAITTGGNSGYTYAAADTVIITTGGGTATGAITGFLLMSKAKGH